MEENQPEGFQRQGINQESSLKKSHKGIYIVFSITGILVLAILVTIVFDESDAGKGLVLILLLFPAVIILVLSLIGLLLYRLFMWGTVRRGLLYFLAAPIIFLFTLPLLIFYGPPWLANALFSMLEFLSLDVLGLG
jgi:hypothetical protein